MYTTQIIYIVNMFAIYRDIVKGRYKMNESELK